jgi:dephospho-CoA kinase
MFKQNIDKIKRPYRIGITGGIGSGKTTVCQIFESLGIPIYYADYWAKWLIENDEKIVAEMVQAFGAETYIDGKYNRAYIADIVFKDKSKLAQINAIVHPAVEQHSQNWHAQQIHAPYTIKEAALMIESGSHQYLDGLIVVTAPEAVRIVRVMARDGSDENAVRNRIANQMPESQKVALADWVIENDGKRGIVPQVWTLHQILK